MFPKGLCEAADIIEERRALLNSQAYYQLSCVVQTLADCVSLSLNLVAHSTGAQRAFLISRFSEKTKDFSDVAPLSYMPHALVFFNLHYFSFILKMGMFFSTQPNWIY